MVKKIQSIVFHNTPDNFNKAMWRMTRGSRSMSFKIIREYMSRYDYNDVSDADIDDALAELTGGCEIEWACE